MSSFFVPTMAPVRASASATPATVSAIQHLREYANLMGLT